MAVVADSMIQAVIHCLFHIIGHISVQSGNPVAVIRIAVLSRGSQLKQGIADIASQTTYNTKHLLDGTEDEFRLKTDPNGGEASVTAANATLESLGIADFDVTKDFDITKIDKALEKVQTQRSTAGAQSNALAYQVSVNSGASYNLTAANSRISDLDMAKGINAMDKQRLLDTVSVMMQKKRQEDEARRHLGLFT